ncbi:MAG: galactose ABC transporter substrate-binding protein, partial [Blautia sp.]|nr:galactose ABC transporter substrate-binding protein [Blautia sp.]
MRKKNIITAGILFCMALQGLSGCKKQDLPSQQAIYIGVTYYDQSDIFLNELLDCFKEEIRE